MRHITLLVKKMEGENVNRDFIYIFWEEARHEGEKEGKNFLPCTVYVCKFGLKFMPLFFVGASPQSQKAPFTLCTAEN